MLLQPADDGAAGSSIAFGAWPCAWDVDFKLAAPLNTTVSSAAAVGLSSSRLARATTRSRKHARLTLGGLQLAEDEVHAHSGMHDHLARRGSQLAEG